jgi:hypothetical protein
MLDRLKSLPLTVALTLLIWLYAESQVPTNPEVATRVISGVEVWPAGPLTEILNDYDLIITPQWVDVTLTGSSDVLDSLPRRSVTAYLDIEPRDVDSTVEKSRRLRIIAPSGVNVVQPRDVRFRLIEKVPPARPVSAR